MTGSSTLMKALDAAAAALLKRHFPETVPEDVAQPQPQDQIKAFAAVVNYYGPRNKFGKNDEGNQNEFSKLKDRLHGRGKTRRSPRAPEGGANGSASAADDPAGTA